MLRHRAAGEQGADAAAPQQVAPQPHDREVGGLRTGGGSLGGLYVQHPHAERADAAGEPAASVDRHLEPLVQPYLPAVEQDRRVADARELARPGLAAEGEDALVLEEELALLGEVEAEPGEVDLLLVGLDLREVGVHGQIRHQVLGDAVLDVEPRVRGRVVGDRRVRRANAVQLSRGVRLDLEIETAARRLETDQGRRLRDLHDGAEAPRGGERHQRRVLVLPGHAPLDVEAPGLRPAGPVTQRPERDLRLERPAAREPAGANVPDRVPVAVPGAFVGDLTVHPAPEGVDDELDGVAAVVEGVEENPDVLAQPPLGASPSRRGQRRANPRWGPRRGRPPRPAVRPVLRAAEPLAGMRSRPHPRAPRPPRPGARPRPGCGARSPSRRRCGPAGRRGRRGSPRRAPSRPQPRSRDRSAARPCAAGRQRVHSRPGSATVPPSRGPPRIAPPRRRSGGRPSGRPPRPRQHRDSPARATPSAASRPPPRRSTDRRRRRPGRRTAPPPRSRSGLRAPPTGPPLRTSRKAQRPRGRHWPPRGSLACAPACCAAPAQDSSAIGRTATMSDSRGSFPDVDRVVGGREGACWHPGFHPIGIGNSR